MTQPFADALTWMPKSRALGATLTRAHDIARAHGHAAVLLEHLLQALIEDPDASAVLLSCNIDLLNLNTAVTAHLQAQPVAGSSQPEASPSLLTILEYAAAAARQSKRSEVSGAIVLAAMAGEGKSDAARMLKAAGLKFEDTIQALKKSSAQKPAVTEAPSPSGPGLRTGTRPASPSMATDIQLPLAAAASALPPAAHDEDPLTTARRRVAALRVGQSTAQVSSPQIFTSAGVAASAHAVGQPASSASLPAGSAADTAEQTWAPPPQPAAAGSNVRPMRMPPPVPTVPLRPPQATASGAAGKPGGAALQLRAPWSPPGGEAVADPLPFPSAPIAGEPIDPTRLTERFPYKMQDRVSATVEVRIPRSAVVATATAMNASARDNRDTALTRAVTVRLRAPSGGFYVEMAAPETQWFDARSAPREDDEVRWRWVVTPQSSGTKPLQIAVGMRTIAADGTVIDTALPEHQFSIRVGSNYREGMRRLGRGFLALSAGVAVTLLATGGLAGLFR